MFICVGSSLSSANEPNPKVFFLSKLNKSQVGKRLLKGFSELENVSFKWVHRAGIGVVAEFNEAGEVLFDYDRMNTMSPDVFISFAVHELMHAKVFYYHQTKKIPVYNPSSKMNEVLAYYAQCEYLGERARDPLYIAESYGIASWDRALIEINSVLRNQGIDEQTPKDLALTILADLELESESYELMAYWNKIRNLYLFMKENARPGLLLLTEDKAEKIQPVGTICGLIQSDIAGKDLSFSSTMTFFRDRIPLYSNYSEEKVPFEQIVQITLKN